MSDSKCKFQNGRAEKLYGEFAPDEVIDPGDGGGWVGLYLVPNRGGCILHEDSLGFVTISCESDDGAIWLAWEEFRSMLEPSREPEDGDFVIDSNLLIVEAGVSGWSQEAVDLQDAEWIIRERMESENFFPDVWLVSERGEFQRHELDGGE